MKQLPNIEDSLLMRTDFSEDAAWASLCEAVQEPNEDGFKAHLVCISDPVYDGLTVEQLIALAPKGDQCGQHTFAFIADRTTFASPEQPVLVIDLYDKPGHTFRAPCARQIPELSRQSADRRTARAQGNSHI